MDADQARRLVKDAPPERERVKWIREEADRSIFCAAQSAGRSMVQFGIAAFSQNPDDIDAVCRWLAEDGFNATWLKNHPVLFGTVEISWN